MTLDEQGQCQCPVQMTFNSQLRLCLEIDTLNGERQTLNITKDFYNSTQLQRRRLDTTQSSPIVLSGQNLTLSNVDFVVAAGVLAYNQYLITVDPTTYIAGQQITFTNCIFNISGNCFYSTKPIKTTFINCTFNLINTTSLIYYDYSDGSGCPTSSQYGSLNVTNSIFQDGSGFTTLSTTSGYLIYLKSLFDMSFTGNIFKNMKLGQTVNIQDYSCGSTGVADQQDIIFFNNTFNNTNMNWQFSYTNSKNLGNQLTLSVSNSTFQNLTPSTTFFSFTQTQQSSYAISLTSNTYNNLTLSQSMTSYYFYTFTLNQSSIMLTNESLSNSLMNNFISVISPMTLTIQKPLKLQNITNAKQEIDSLSGLINVQNASSLINITGLWLWGSTLNETSVLYVNGVQFLQINSFFTNKTQLTGIDLVQIKNAQKFWISNTNVSLLTSTNTTNSLAVYSIMNLQLVQGYSSFTLNNTSMINSQTTLFNANTATLAVSTDSSEYSFNLTTCAFSGNTYTNYDLYTFTGVSTSSMELNNNKCLDPNSIQSCTSGNYFDPILKACNSCPTGCATCTSLNACTSCLATNMTIDQITGQCECPYQWYYYSVDYPRCRQCLSKCATCNNEYMCMTYAICPNKYQNLQADGTCSFKCTTGAFIDANTCTTCKDPNCQICDQVNSTTQRCGLCQNGYFLDISTYTCVASCPPMSKQISSTNVYNWSQQINYCRPFIQNTNYKYQYYVDPNSTSHIELGTFEYPYKNMDPPVKEVFNFMYENTTDFTVFHKWGTSMKTYYGIMPLIALNVQMYNLTTYGNSSLTKPRVYVTGHQYLWPDSSLFNLAETYYDLTTRVNRGDMSTSEATTYFLKFNTFRSSMYIKDIDFQSIMFGDAWSNPLVFSFDNKNQTITYENTYLDLDGALQECYYPVNTHLKNAHINLTNYEYGVWNDFRWDCVAANAQYIQGYLIIEGTRFTETQQQALYNFLYFGSIGDFILRNNTFDGAVWINMETRPFLDVHPQTLCDPSFRVQNIVLDQNTFINLYQSNLIFAVNYMNTFNATRIFSYQNNQYINSQINTQFISMQIQNPSQVTVGNNYYQNVSVLKDQLVFYFFSSNSNITVTNETLVNNTLDDLYQIGAANAIQVKDFSVLNNQNTGTITETSAILRISTANMMAVLNNYTVVNSTFQYGKAIEIESALYLELKNSAQFNNKLFNQDFIVLNQLNKALISNLSFTQFQKSSDKSLFAISLPTLSLSKAANSSFLLQNITFKYSQSSFLSISQVSVDTGATDPFQFNMSNCLLDSNQLSSKDSLIEFGEINYKQFIVNLNRVDLVYNNLELGTIYSLLMNSQSLLINNSRIFNNSGQFAALQPASSDTSNPLYFYINNTTFIGNYAKADALIQLTTNSLLYTSNSIFKENYSIGRGSIVFADYQKVYAQFKNCTMSQNYAYQGGVFYIQYSSVVEVANCTLNNNYAITGGVAYVNNDGSILMNSHTSAYLNSAINTCFIFLINSQLDSMIDSLDITANDQNHALINKNSFLGLQSSYQFLNMTFIAAMQAIGDKVQRTASETSDSAVYAIKANINFTNSFIHNNDMFLSASTESTVSLTNCTFSDLQATGQIIQAVSSTIEFYNFTIRDITHTNTDASTTSTSITSNTNYQYLSIVNKSYLRVVKSLFTRIIGALLYVSGSSLSAEGGTWLKNITNDWLTDANIIQIDTSDITFDNVYFKQLSSQYVTPIINFQENSVLAHNLSFDGFDKTLFSLDTGYDYNFTLLNITNGMMTYASDEKEYMINSIVFDANAVNISLVDANITSIYTDYSSPVVYIENDPASTDIAYLYINRSTFVNNSALLQAGVVYALNTNVFVNNSMFRNNSAYTEDAGALYLDCQDTVTYMCNYTIQNSVFKNNSAMVNGGAIKYTYYKPDTSKNNTFVNNTAIYGNDMASYQVQMVIIDSTGRRRRLEMLNATETAALGITNGVVFKIDTDLVSGSLITQNVSLVIQDEMGRIINTDNTSVAVMSSMASAVQVMKSKSVNALNGMFTFDDVIIIGPPGQDIILTITSDAIDSTKLTNAFPNFIQEEIYLKAYLRLCERGEYQSSDNKCIVCSDGFYTLMDNQTSCNECPENAVCSNGYEIISDAGYWRQDVNSTDIYACYNSAACLGGYDVACDTGYGGNLCQSCVEVNGTWYSRQSANDCSECISYSLNASRLAGVVVLILVYFTILIFVNIRTAGQQKFTTVYMRILTNYFQILTLAQSYDLSWDDNLKKFLTYISFIGQSSDIILSVDCFVRDNGIQTHPAYIKMVIACVFPLIMIAFVTAFWALFKLVRQNYKVITSLISSIIIVIFICLPTITSITFGIFNCVDIFSDGDTFLALDMSIQCWQGSHSYYANSFGIPIIVIWIIGLPLVMLTVLIVKRQRLNDVRNMHRYGFLYIGLNQQAFYWEFLLHFRKVLLICINVFFTTFKPLYRALIGFMIMIIYIEFLQKIQPYATTELNDLEFKANIAAFATFYGGLFFISEDLPFGVSIFLFLLILFINLIFWFSWFKLTFNNFYLRLHKYLSKYFYCLRKKQATKGEGADEIDDANAQQLEFNDISKIEPQGNQDGPEQWQTPSNMMISGLKQKGEEDEEGGTQGSSDKKGRKTKKKIAKNGKSEKIGQKNKKLKNLNDSQMYALANDESSRNFEESQRLDNPQLYLVNGNSKIAGGIKNPQVIDKKQSQKRAAKEEEELRVDSQSVTEKKKKSVKQLKGSDISIVKGRKKISSDEIANNFTNSVSDSDDEKNSNKKKKKNQKFKKNSAHPSTSDMDSNKTTPLSYEEKNTQKQSTNLAGDSQKSNKPANAGQIIDRSSSNNTDQHTHKAKDHGHKKVIQSSDEEEIENNQSSMQQDQNDISIVELLPQELPAHKQGKKTHTPKGQSSQQNRRDKDGDKQRSKSKSKSRQRVRDNDSDATDSNDGDNYDQSAQKMKKVNLKHMQQNNPSHSNKHSNADAVERNSPRGVRAFVSANTGAKNDQRPMKTPNGNVLLDSQDSSDFGTSNIQAHSIKYKQQSAVTKLKDPKNKSRSPNNKSRTRQLKEEQETRERKKKILQMSMMNQGGSPSSKKRQDHHDSSEEVDDDSNQSEDNTEKKSRSKLNKNKQRRQNNRDEDSQSSEDDKKNKNIAKQTKNSKVTEKQQQNKKDQKKKNKGKDILSQSDE